jgi:hypothetical protein
MTGNGSEAAKAASEAGNWKSTYMHRLLQQVPVLLLRIALCKTAKSETTQTRTVVARGRTFLNGVENRLPRVRRKLLKHVVLVQLEACISNAESGHQHAEESRQSANDRARKAGAVIQHDGAQMDISAMYLAP